MKIKTINRLPLLILSVLAGIAALVVVGVIYNQRDTTIVQGPTKAQQDTQRENDISEKRDFVEQKQSNVTEAKAATIPTDTNQISLTAAQQSNNIVITTHLSGFSSGVCTIIVTNGTKSTTQQATILYQPEFSTCTGFSVPVSSVGPGSWTIELQVTPAGGQVLTKTITSTVK